MKKTVPALLFTLSIPFTAIAFAEPIAWEDSSFYNDEPPQGGLIFQEREGPEADALRTATRSSYTAVGIIQLTGGGPYVMESTPDTGVTVTQIDEFVQRGVGGRYAIYEVEGISAPPGWYHPFVERYYDFIHLPFDPHYTSDDTAIYGAELVYRIARAEGIAIGMFQRLGDLFDTPAGRAFFLSRWQEHPECSTLDEDQCWALMQEQEIITPASIAESANVKLVVSTF